MSGDYVPDQLYKRLFQPWSLPDADWPLCVEDWRRVDATCALPWSGRVLDIGCGDGTLGALVCSRNPKVRVLRGVEPDFGQVFVAQSRWQEWPMGVYGHWPTLPECAHRCDGLLCAEVLEHVSPDDGVALLSRAVGLCMPGALVCVTSPDPEGTRAVYPGHINVMTPWALEEMVREAGCHVERVDHIADIWTMVVARVL